MSSEIFVDFQELQTERLILRCPTMDDLDAVMAYTGDPEAVKYLIIDVQTRESSGAWLASCIEKNSQPTRSFAWAICLQETGECLGVINISFGKENNPFAATIGYASAKKYWGNGFIPEAAKVVVDFTFECPAYIDSIYIPVFAPNIGSAKVAQKLGFTAVSQITRNYFLKGNFVDSVTYQLLRSDWELQKSQSQITE
jgi:ribosomal-protein-alanine N-acetyltransferase